MSSASIGGRKHSDSHSETRQPKKARDKPPLSSAQTTTAAPPVMSGTSGATRKRKLDAADSVTAVDLDTDSSGGDGTSSTSLQSAQPKISRASSEAIEGGTMAVEQDASSSAAPRFGLGDQHQHPVAHRYMVNISETSLLLPHRASSSYTMRHTDATRSSSSLHGLDVGVPSTAGMGVAEAVGGASRRKSLVFKFDCELGDMWIESGYERGRRRRTIAGNTGTDKLSSDVARDLQLVESLELQGYTVQGQLAKGRFGVVLAAHSVIRRRDVALKMFEREIQPRGGSTDLSSGGPSSSMGSPSDLPNELQIQRQLKHSNVVELYDYHVINNRITMVMELCDNGNLRHLLTATPGSILSERVCRRYFRHMFGAVAYLHSQGIVHRDIKCENFLIDRHNCVKLGDFSSARHHAIGDELSTTRHGTAGYWSPEVIARLPYNPRTADVWALGVTLHILLTSRFPFSGDDRHVLIGMQKGIDLHKGMSVHLSREVSELLKGLLHYVLQVRYTINRIRCSDWLRLSDGDKPYIGNFYLVSTPRKFKDGPQERTLKESFGI